MVEGPRPGDIVMSTVPGGFLIGRLLPEVGAGPWWANVGTASTLHDAVRIARHHAPAGRAWMSGEEWHEVPLTTDWALA